MIIKSLSRKSGGTSQLFDYLFRYMLDEEKSKPVPAHIMPFVEKAGKYKTAKEFENAMDEEGLLQYHGTQKNFSGVPNTQSKTFGWFGNGFYLTSDLLTAKSFSSKDGAVKKYLINPDAKLFTAGPDGERYAALQDKILNSSGLTFSSPAEKDMLAQMVRIHLEKEGYAGITATNETVIYDAKAITELTKDFFKEAKRLSKEKDSTPELKQPQFVIRHNIRSRTVSGYAKEFEKNEALRIHKRKDNVAVYHTILSFSNKDKEHVNEKVLTDMAKKYIELRGKDNLYVITSHHDKDHVHLHCAMSGTKLNGLSSRISRAEFANIKVTLDTYQKEKHPELVHSLPKHGRGKQLDNREELKNIKRNERSLDKNSLLKVLDEIYSKATSREQFLSELSALGHMPYYRAGKLTGVKFNDERKFRLNRLGYDEKKIAELQKQKTPHEKAVQELSDIRNNRQPQRELIQPPISFEERMKSLNGNSSAEQKKDTQEHLATNAKDIHALQTLKDIRENRSNEIDKTNNREDVERDRADERNNNKNDAESKDSNSNDDDKNSESNSADNANDATFRFR